MIILLVVIRFINFLFMFLVSEHKSGGELLGLIEKFAPLPENIVRIFIAEIALAIGLYSTF